MITACSREFLRFRERWFRDLEALEMSKSKRCLVEIQVEGRLDANWTEWLEGLKVTHVGSRTLLKGEVRDQAALYGLIAKLRDLGVELVSVENREIKERPEGRGCISPN